MKKKFLALLVGVVLCAALSIPAVAVSGEFVDNSTIMVSATELEPGYYLCAAWRGDMLLRLFDYTVKADGKLDAIVELGEKLEAGDKVTVGISNANAGAEPIPPIICEVKSTSPNNPGRPTVPDYSFDFDSYVDNTRYEINVPGTSGGTVNVSPAGSAAAGRQVTIDVKPDAGYAVGSVAVTAANGRPLTVSRRGSSYVFTMPGSAVDIRVEFRAIAPAEGQSSSGFADVSSGDWFAGAVRYVTGRDVMSGTGNGYFSPDATTTRGMIATILHNLEGNPAAGAGGFTDVGGQWYASPVAWASQNGVVSGYPDGRFGPVEAVTREQLAVILYNYAVMKGYSTSAQAGLDSFTDGGSVSSWARTAVSWASAKGLINVMGDGSLAPQGRATRAQVASILMNFCENAAR